MQKELSKIYSCYYFQVSFKETSKYAKTEQNKTKQKKPVNSNILIILVVLQFLVLQNYFELDTFYMGVKGYAGK